MRFFKSSQRACFSVRSRAVGMLCLGIVVAGCGGKTKSVEAPASSQAEPAEAEVKPAPQSAPAPRDPGPSDIGGPPDAVGPAAPPQPQTHPEDIELRQPMIDLAASDEETRQAAVDYFESRGDLEWETVVAMSSGGSIDIRRGAVHWLLMRLDPRNSAHIELFVNLLSDDDAVVRHVAVQAARQFEIPQLKEALPELVSLLKPDRDTGEYRAIVVRLLQKLRLDAAPALEPLNLALRTDPDVEVRKACVYAIVRIAHPEKSAELLRPTLLEDKSPDVRRLAAVRLGRLDIFSDQTMRDLVLAFDDEDETVRDAAAEALVAFGSPSVEHLAKSLEVPAVRVRLVGLVALGRLGARAASAAPQVEKCLTDENQQVRELAEAVLRLLKGSSSAAGRPAAAFTAC